jgi:hypothetical protein
MFLLFQDALRIHSKLKEALVQNVIKEYYRTGLLEVY